MNSDDYPAQKLLLRCSKHLKQPSPKARSWMWGGEFLSVQPLVLSLLAALGSHPCPAAGWEGSFEGSLGQGAGRAGWDDL